MLLWVPVHEDANSSLCQNFSISFQVNVPDYYDLVSNPTLGGPNISTPPPTFVI
jgi:hypothetical protein